MIPAAIDVREVSLVYRGQNVLENINLRLEPSAFLGLIGPNGAGKTMLLKIILGLIKPTAGEVLIFGKPVQDSRGIVGYVPQYAKFEAGFPISVLNVVLMGRLGRRKFFKPYTKEDRELAMEALAKVELSNYAQNEISKLSGGQIQRVLIARALAVQPKILLLDEPTASLDTKIGRDVYQLLDVLSNTMTIVLVSHDIGVIASHVKTIACLNRRLHYHESKELSGEVVAEVYGCPVELIAHGHAPHRILSEHKHKDCDDC